MSGITTFLVYFAPTLIAWYRTRQGMPVVGSVVSLLMMNLFFGWTGVVWLLVLVNAFGKNPVAWLAVRLVRVASPGQSGSAPSGLPSSSQPGLCGQCQGSGSMTCPTCGGRGSWYDPPQGEHGTAQLVTCTYCTSSGRVQCTTCGGSGRTAPSL